MRVARAGALALVVAVLGRCGGDGAAPGGAGDAVVPSDARVDTAGEDVATAEDVATVEACSPLGEVEAVAAAWEVAVQGSMTAEGLDAAAVAPVDEIDVRGAQHRELRASRTTAPVYFGGEDEILALPGDDPVREAWVEGDIRAPDWAFQGLLVYWELSPYTDNRLYSDGTRLVLATLRLEPCLDAGEPGNPPVEFAHRWARVVPRVATVEHRVDTRWYRLATFPVDPAFERHPTNPLIDRAGGNGVVVETDQGFHMWLNGYSAATGFILHATSEDGVAWDFAWNDAHTCSFEGVGLFRRKRDPAVIREGDGFTMWFTMEGETPTAPTLLYRSTSTDGLSWSEPRISGGAAAARVRSPFVAVHEGTYHLFGHDPDSLSILHATSADGRTWSDPQTILSPGGGPDAPDWECALQPAAVHDGARWLMVYTACYAPRVATNSFGQPVWYAMNVALATSADGAAWERSDRLLLRQTRTPGHWESGNLGRPVLLLQGPDAWLYYTGVEGGEPSVGLSIAEGWSL